MASWSTRKKTYYITGFSLAITLTIGISLLFTFYAPPTCFDGEQNQGEFGIDCGGPCSLLCKNQSLDLIVHWQRVFEVFPGEYSAIAYVENPNPVSGIDSIPYVFKVYDSRNILIAERAGKTFIPAKKLFPIYEPIISTGERIPMKTELVFESEPVWKAYGRKEPELYLSWQPIIDEDTRPLIKAKIINQTASTIKNFNVVAIVYDGNNNAQAASKTLVDVLGPNSEASITFSWPKPFSSPATKIEVVPELYPGINY